MKNRFWVGVVVLLVLVGGFYAMREEHGGHEGHGAEEAFEKGAHGGRLLEKEDLAVEVTIFEQGVPPQFRVYVTEDGKAVKPEALVLEVTRLGGKVERFSFVPQEEYWVGEGEVREPHSFDVKVTATYEGEAYQWEYASYEGRTEITAEAAEAGGVKTQPAGTAMIRETVTLNGTIALDPNKTAQIKARFPGIVREVKKNLGEAVVAGDVLARVEGNDSLQIYPVTSPIDGVILARNTNTGDVAGDVPLFIVSDLSGVWAEFHVFHRDMPKIAVGNAVYVDCSDDDVEGVGKVDAFLPTAETVSQTMLARVGLDNSEGHWRAGMNVTGRVVVREHEVPLAVKNTALQRFRDHEVVFAKVGDVYEVRMLELGVSDGDWTEVKAGLEAGEEYVTEGSFLVKADIEKAGAAHDH